MWLGGYRERSVQQNFCNEERGLSSGWSTFPCFDHLPLFNALLCSFGDKNDIGVGSVSLSWDVLHKQQTTQLCEKGKFFDKSV